MENSPLKRKTEYINQRILIQQYACKSNNFAQVSRNLFPVDLLDGKKFKWNVQCLCRRNESLGSKVNMLFEIKLKKSRPPKRE